MLDADRMALDRGASSSGFVRAQAGQLVDGADDPVLLRGVGLGNWLLPEGYMFRFFQPAPQSPREIEALIAELVGPDEAEIFWRRYRDNWIGERDIAAIAAAGMNHVRVPINSRVVMDDDGAFIDNGIALVDRLIEWCRQHGLWVVLDLHGAPGGQTGTNIDDSPNGAPELFTSSHYRALTITLWRMLAERYRDDPTVAGYDLLNEPLPEPHGGAHSEALADLYRELTRAIRGVDSNHLIIYEGTHWATNWDIFTEVWDENSAMSFHKYWSPPDRASIDIFLRHREALGLPIYMGEGGENGLGWLQTAFQLYDDCEISWNFWPWKKLDTYSSPCSVVPPPGWDAVVGYGHGGKRPGPSAAAETLDALIEAVQFDHCVYRPEVIAALRRTAPVRISAAAFGFRGAQQSYSTSRATPQAGFRADDRVTIRPIEAPKSGVSFDYTDGPDRYEQRWEVELCVGDWVAYEFGLRDPTVPRISIQGRRRQGGTLEIAVGETTLTCQRTVDGWLATTSQPLAEGRHQLRLLCKGAPVTLTAISIE
jgi:endoglucanase